MDKANIIEAILETKVVTIIRTDFPGKISKVAQILLEVGLPVLEVTSNTPDYLNVIQELRRDFPNLIIGAGTIINQNLASEAIKAGAMYLVTPNTSKKVMKYAKKKGVPVAMGAFSPSEIHNAVSWGAEFIKIFPANHLGPKYLKAVSATLGEVNYLPTGGVRVDNLAEWTAAGAKAFGIGGGIVSNSDLAQGDFDKIKTQALLFKNKLQEIG